MNRATADTAQEAALDEGLAPLMGWVKRLADHVIQHRMGQPDLEFAWIELRPAAPAEQAKLLDTYVRTGIYTLNEARDLLGLAALPGGDTPLVYASTGPIPLAAPAAPNPLPHRGRGQGEGAAAAPPTAIVRAAAPPLAKYDPDEPRNPDGGQWTSDAVAGEPPMADSEGAPEKPVQLAEDRPARALSRRIAKGVFCAFPGQFLNAPVANVLEAAKSGDAAARSAKKLLFDNRYRK